MHFTGRTWRPPYEASPFIIKQPVVALTTSADFAVYIKTNVFVCRH